MADYLVIVESPAKAKTINKYMGNAYKVEASMGHVRDLPKSKLGINVDDNFAPHYIISNDKKKVVSHLKKAAKGIKRIYLAADPDREGEAICWHLSWILQHAGSEDIKRVTFNEITPDAIRQAFKHPRDINIDLVNAQQARRLLDRLVGYKISPLLWKNVARGLSAGRVQSVALKLIIDREQEIKNFQAKEYWTLEAIVSSRKKEYKNDIFSSRLESINGEKIDIGTQQHVDSVSAELRGASFVVSRLDTREKMRKPQPPFITSKLQQEAFTKLHFPAQKTMRIAQRLYEGLDLGKEGSVGLITYMRTDSVTVSKAAMDEVREYITQTYGNEYLSAKPNVYKSRKHAQQAHEAIRPTSVHRDPEHIKDFLATDEYKLYSLIWKRFVSSQMSDAKDSVHSIEILAREKYLFKTTSTVNLFPGFLKVYVEIEPDETDDESEKKDAKQKNKVPPLAVGEELDCHELLPGQHFTKPPARYNDASLVKTLEELGVGRPSTYAPIIQTILARHYVQRRAAALEPTDMGILVIEMLVKHFSYLIDVGFTARMEEELDEVEDGTKEWTAVLSEFYGIFAKHVEAAHTEMQNVKKNIEPSEHVCDVCGNPMIYRWGRFGKFLACSKFPECKYTKSIPTGFRCPLESCGGELVRRQSKKKRVFYGCSRYPKCTYTVNRLPDAPAVEIPQTGSSETV